MGFCKTLGEVPYTGKPLSNSQPLYNALSWQYTGISACSALGGGHPLHRAPHPPQYPLNNVENLWSC
jgi:hypothetical protein